jgi:hypothetical protein
VTSAVADPSEWDLLIAEYQRVQVGTLWISLVVEVCENIVRRYRPDVYNHGLEWDGSAIDELAQDVILERLLVSGQIDYIVAAAGNTQSARGLVGMHVKQVLSQRVIPNQRDNVAERLFPLIAEAGEAISTGDGIGYRPEGTEWPAREANSSEIARAVRKISELPRLPNRGSDRLSPLFTTESLKEAVPGLMEALGCPVTLNLLRTVLGKALTGLSPALFQLDERVDLPDISGLSVEEAVIVDDLADRLIDGLTAEQREILVNIEHLTDAELAALLGVSRPTALKRRHGTRDAIGTFFSQPGLNDLSDDLKGAVLLRTQDMLGGGRNE